jgi:predicted nucleic acid-binding protein
MERPAPKSLLALDTNILFALAEEENFAVELLELAAERNCSLALPPIAILELVQLAANSGPLRKAATLALTQMRSKWAIEPLTLSATEMAIAISFTGTLLSRNFLPTQERNDALLLAQVAVKSIPFLVTSDSHFLNISHEEMSTVFLDQHLSPVSIISPMAFLRTLSPRKRRHGRY